MAKVIASLSEHLEAEEIPEEEAPVRNAHRYLSNRLDCLDYPSALALGLPIGSGIIENGHAIYSKPDSKNPGPLGWRLMQTR